ncbi:MAG: DUF2147 domain-containing protein, partial [Cyclobacteriaceae bacterium]|nr:DUF2147 domain-containing protein [Cyclobacteriaceae bacterium]MDX5467169.1 DUF2147 domain-containing protein [Cyclobacteriaceae bacterium]
MKKLQLISVLLVYLFLGLSQASAQTESSILGVWYNTEKTAQVEILKTGSEYIGKIVWLKEPIRDGKPATDQENSDPKL